MDAGRPGERYLVGACNLTVAEFFARLERVSGVSAPRIPAPRSREAARLAARVLRSIATRVGLPSPVDPETADMASCFFYLDAGKAERELGWTARDPNETLYDTVEDLRARGAVWPRSSNGRPAV
jgi:dihydroflavonol-4-reductase